MRSARLGEGASGSGVHFDVWCVAADCVRRFGYKPFSGKHSAAARRGIDVCSSAVNGVPIVAYDGFARSHHLDLMALPFGMVTVGVGQEERGERLRSACDGGHDEAR